MRFVRKDLGAAAEASSGGGGRGMVREIIVMLGGALLLVVGLYSLVSLIVSLALPLISYEREQRWFGGMRIGASATPCDDRDEPTSDEAQRVGLLLDRLTALPDTPPMGFSIFILPDPDPNAFAIPGGAIGVTTGLLSLLDDDIALAFVLGHELGHFAHRDHLRGLGRRIGHSVVLGVVFGRSGANLASDQVARLLDLSYSRGQEEKADAYGLRLVQEAYGTTEGSDRLFAWLDANHSLPAWAAIMSTHPDPADRIDRLKRLSNPAAGR